MISVFCFLLATIFIATYTANLAALLTTELLAEEINSVEELAHQTEFKYGTDFNSGTWQFFDQSTISLYKLMAGNMRKGRTFATIDEGLARVRSENYAYIWDKAVLDFETLLKPCDLRTVGEPFNRVMYGYALPRGSPVTKELNIHILQLRENGFSMEILDKWYSDRSECREFEDQGNLRQLSTYNMMGVFLTIVFGIATSFLVFLAEWVIASKNAIKNTGETELRKEVIRRIRKYFRSGIRQISVPLKQEEVFTRN